MTEVIHGFCPDCGKTTDGDPRGPRLGALCFSLDDVTRGSRATACACGSRARPVPTAAAPIETQPELAKLRRLVEELEGDRHYPGTNYAGWEQRHAELAVRVQAQSVLALDEQNASVVARLALIEARLPCVECGQANGSHLGTCSKSAMHGGGSWPA